VDNWYFVDYPLGEMVPHSAVICNSVDYPLPDSTKPATRGGGSLITNGGRPHVSLGPGIPNSPAITSVRPQPSSRHRRGESYAPGARDWGRNATDRGLPGPNYSQRGDNLQRNQNGELIAGTFPFTEKRFQTFPSNQPLVATRQYLPTDRGRNVATHELPHVPSPGR
jgi:hypothetical protein